MRQSDFCIGVCIAILFGSIMIGVGIRFITSYHKGIIDDVMGAIFILFGLCMVCLSCIGFRIVCRDMHHTMRYIDLRQEGDGLV